MNKCLTLVHLTSMFRIHSGVPGDSKASNLWSHEQWSTALLGCLWPIGLAPVATGATGAVGQHWTSWRSDCFGGLFASKVAWTWVFVQGAHRWAPQPKPSPRSAGLLPIEKPLRLRFRRYYC